MEVILKEKLKLLGFDDFKSEKQREATINVLEGNHDVLIHMPPGSGKSLCYQLPAIVSCPKIAIVFVPNISSSDGQIEFLKTRGIGASQLWSPIINGKKKVLKKGWDDFLKEAINLLYVPISILNSEKFMSYLADKHQAKSISFLVIDEANCVSENNADYDKNYELVKIKRSLFPNLRLVALTSTVTNQVCKDIIMKLGMENVNVVESQIHIMPNIHIDVNFMDIIANPIEHMIQLIKYSLESEEDRVIIFCRKVEQTFAVSKMLTDKKILTVPYTDRLKIEIRRENKKLWKSGEVKVIAVTHHSIFWLDHKSIRCVIHWTMPSTISQYYREIAIAGCDGKRAICRLYYSIQESSSLQFDSLKRSPTIYKDSQRIIDFCFAAECRHALYMASFGVTGDSCHDSCDNCCHRDAVRVMLDKFNIYESSKQLFNRKFQENDEKTRTVPPVALRELPENFQTLLNVYSPSSVEKKYLRIQDRWFCYHSLLLALIENYHQSDEETGVRLKLLDIFTLGRMMEYLAYTHYIYRNFYFHCILHTVNHIKHSTEIHKTSNFILNYYPQQESNSPEKNSKIQDFDCIMNQDVIIKTLHKSREDFVLANGKLKFYTSKFNNASWHRIAEKIVNNK